MGNEAFDLGLLTGMEPDPQDEDQQQAYSFSHLIFQEFAAGKFAAILNLVSFFFQSISEQIVLDFCLSIVK